jgi:hypothetical protein
MGSSDIGMLGLGRNTKNTLSYAKRVIKDRFY